MYWELWNTQLTTPENAFGYRDQKHLSHKKRGKIQQAPWFPATLKNVFPLPTWRNASSQKAKYGIIRNVWRSYSQYITMSYGWNRTILMAKFSGAQHPKRWDPLKISLLLLESSWELISFESLAAIMHKQCSPNKRATVGCMFNLCEFNPPW